FVTEARRLADIPRIVRLVGAVAGSAEVAEARARQFENEIAVLRKRYAAERRVAVFLEIWHAPALTVNGVHLISDALRLCGGHNVFAAAKTLTPLVSREQILDARPEAIVTGGFGSEALRAWRGLESVPAVRNKRIYAIDPDWLHAQGPHVLQGVRALCERFGLALNPYHRYTLAAERRLFENPRLRAVICNSRMVRDEIRAHFGTPEAKLHVIYNGIDLEAFHPRLREAHRSTMRQKLGIPQHVPVHLHVGAGFERKGVFRLIEALARSRQPGAHLVIVGRDKAQTRAERLASSRGIASRVHFAGVQANMGPWY